MRRLMLAVAMVLVLSGCISTIEGAYDDHARRECDQETRGSARSACHDRVDQNRRDRN